MYIEWIWILWAFTALIIFMIGVPLSVVFRQKVKASDLNYFLQDALDAPAYGLVFFDEHGRMCLANSAAHKFLPFLKERSPGEGVYLPAFLNYFFDHAIDVDQSLQNLLDKFGSGLTSERFREIIGWGEDKICIVESQKTPSGRTVMVLVDVSNLQKQEEYLIRVTGNNYELTQAIEASTSGIIVTDPKKSGNPVVFSNQAFCDYISADKSEVIGANIKLLAQKFQGEEDRRKIYDAFDGEDGADIDLCLGDDTAQRWFNLKISPVYDSRGALDLLIGVFTETTELKEREGELFQSRKLEALGQLAAGVSHDFNNVLSIIDGFVWLAINHPDNKSAELKDHLENVRAAAGRGASLTRQMMTFTRQKISKKQVCNIAQIVEHQEVLLGPLLTTNVKFSIDIAHEDVFVECNEDNIVQIIMNLSVNARDAMPDGGALTVSLSRCMDSEVPKTIPPSSCGYACLSVSDTGEGMDQKVLERIFDPFFSTRERGKGTGLGLSIVYGLVRQMDGAVSVISAPGEGTTIQIYMPLTDKKPGKKIAGNLEDISSISLEGYTALIAEDEPELLGLVTQMLEGMGMNIICAKNGNEALVKQDEFEGSIDLLLTDVMMPELDGVKLAELFRSERPGAKVIYMSGYPAKGDLTPLNLDPDVPFMAKPIVYEDLTRTIFQILSGDMDCGQHHRAKRAL